MIKKIVLSGGPCGGKTTAIKYVREYFEEKGYIVLSINESATEIINMGIKPFGNNKVDMYEFQKYVFSEQINNEILVDNYINSNMDKKIIVLYDRCILDNKCYVSEEEYNMLLEEFEINEEKYLSQFDLFIHLVSAAIGTNEYNLDNQARSENIIEAMKREENIIKCYSNISNRIVVDNSTNFEGKLKRVRDIIENTLHT